MKKIKTSIRVMFVLAFIVMWFMHTAQPTKNYKTQLNKLKKQTNHQKRSGRLKVVFGG